MIVLALITPLTTNDDSKYSTPKNIGKIHRQEEGGKKGRVSMNMEKKILNLNLTPDTN